MTDEHGADWGQPEGKGRAGLWVRELTRAGVLEALAARRFFASRIKGLRLDAALTSLAAGGPGERARMGTTLDHPGGPARLEVDLDREAWRGRRLLLQVLRPGRRLPTLAATLEVAAPSRSYGAEAARTATALAAVRRPDRSSPTRSASRTSARSSSISSSSAFSIRNACRCRTSTSTSALGAEPRLSITLLSCTARIQSARS